MHFQKIEIDWDIHKAIEAERRGFEEPPYLALRRLLKLPPPSPASVEPEIGGGVPWIEDGVMVPHGSLARMKYQRGRQVYEGKFLNGKLVVDGKEFDTLSAAANALAVTKDGGRTQLNGWIYWEVKIAGQSEWQSLGQMRDAVREKVVL